VSAFRVAWLQLRTDRGRLFAAIAGILFAVVLMLVQLGFEEALFRSSTNLLSHLDAPVVMFSSSFRAMNVPNYFSERRLYQAMAVDGVESVAPLYFDTVMWRNPKTLQFSRIFLVAFPPGMRVLDIPEINRQQDRIAAPGVVLFDRESRPEFGDVSRWLQQGEPVVTEVNSVRTEVAGLFNLGTSFLADGTLVMSDASLLQLLPKRRAGLIDVGLIHLKPGADPARVVEALQVVVGRDVRVARRERLMQMERTFWADGTPIGFVFRFGVGFGLVVGTIIVYQILYTDVSNHLKEYATLKAMGHRDGYLFRIVLWESAILSILGFLPGMLLSQVVYTSARKATLLPLSMSFTRAAIVYGLTLMMCVISGALAMRRLRYADPAGIF
jgi:putative ABC transport system permease protein